MRKTLRNSLTLCAAVLLLSSALLSIGFVKGDVTEFIVTIQPDGSVTPTGAPILIEGNTYTLTENLYASIEIDKSGITLDGAGHSLQGTFNGNTTGLWIIGSGIPAADWNGSQVPWTIGVDIAESNIANLTIKNIKVEDFNIGMYIWTQNNTITKSTIEGSDVGLLVANSQNSFTQNYIENNTYGIFVGIGNPTNPYSNITIDSNYFVDNVNQVNGCHCPASLNETNPWGINVDGNYWSDYNGTAKNGSDVGETPYLVNGTIPDNHPLMYLHNAQALGTSMNLNIEISLAIGLPIIFIIGIIAFKKRKSRLQKTEKAR